MLFSVNNYSYIVFPRSICRYQAWRFKKKIVKSMNTWHKIKIRFIEKCQFKIILNLNVWDFIPNKCLWSVYMLHNLLFVIISYLGSSNHRLWKPVQLPSLQIVHYNKSITMTVMSFHTIDLFYLQLQMHRSWTKIL